MYYHVAQLFQRILILEFRSGWGNRVRDNVSYTEIHTYCHIDDIGLGLK